MAIQLIEYNKRLNGVIADLQSGAHGEVMVQTANNAIALIKARVQEKGINASGSPFAPYSQSYEAYKKKQGKYKGFVDFSFTNRMWSNIKVVSPKEQLDKGVAIVKATTSFEQEKLNKNTESRGDILELSDQNLSTVTRTYEQGILGIFRKNRLL